MMKKKKCLKILAIVLLCYAVIGFFIFPMALRYFGEKALREHVSPDAVVAKVKANPFTWQLQVEGLSLSDPGRQWSLGAERATVNVSARTLYKFHPVLDLVSLESPRISYRRSPKEEVEEEPVGPKEEGPESLEDVANLLNAMEIPEVFVTLLEIQNGAIHFSDVTNESAFEKSVDPINFRLENFTTEVDAGEDNAMCFFAKTDGGAELEWTGKITSQPFASSGTVRVSGFEMDRFSPYFEKLIRFDLERATYGMQFSYAINFGDLENVFKVSDGSVDLTNVLCVGREDEEEFFVLDSAGVAGFRFDYNAMQIDLEQAFVKSGVLGVRRDEAGAINLLNLLVLPEVPTMAPSEVATMAPPEEVAASDDSFELPELPVGFSLGEFLIQDFQIRWLDSMIPGGADLGVVISSYSLKNLSSEFSQPVALDLLLLIGESGRITASGELIPAIAGMDLSLGVEELDLSLGNAYGLSMADTQVGSGAFEYAGGLSGDFESGYRLSGNGSVQDFSVALAGDQAVDLEWKLFTFDGLLANTKPLSVRIGNLILTEPKAMLTQSAPPEASEPEVAPEAAELPEAEVAPEASETVDAEAIAETATPEPAESPLDVFIASFVVDGGSMVFNDEAIQPNFRLEVSEAEVDVKNITLGKEQITEFSIDALVNGSPFAMAGSAFPIDPRRQTKMTMSLSEFSLPVFSPYSGKTVGRKVGSGWFTLDSEFQVDAGNLKASNDIKIDQLKLGDSVDSPDAVQLPLSLAISLLKGPDGVMNLKLPLTGDLYKPNVGLGQIIRTAAFGLIRGVALSPFSMLSSLVGSEEDLSKVEFAAADAQLSPKMMGQLEALGKALQERPQLTLSMRPSLSDDDLTGLAAAFLPPDLETAGAIREESESEEDRRFFANRKGVYRPPVKTGDAPVADENHLEPVILPKVEPTDPVAMELMAARVQAVREQLLAIDGITEERLSVGDPDPTVNRSIIGFSLE